MEESWVEIQNRFENKHFGCNNIYLDRWSFKMHFLWFFSSFDDAHYPQRCRNWRICIVRYMWCRSFLKCFLQFTHFERCPSFKAELFWHCHRQQDPCRKENIAWKFLRVCSQENIFSVRQKISQCSGKFNSVKLSKLRLQCIPNILRIALL